ncbi:phage major capsid protein [Glaciecola sp. KUL10]|uniref:phage major capsid protein n=1 Tax=Glaciecola sp. (strain KUL10) TaxID=2161813 RepID=UPI000D781A43|nr:phage major capsid protein [Glaciecola sp. KUL10]GBL02937.1 phage-related protein [Glaciecola sp. KUL10]
MFEQSQITRDMLVGGQIPIAYRFAEVKPDSVDVENRTAVISFSSEYEVERYGWFETLGHNRDEVDLSRIEQNGPFLCDHDWKDQRGVITKAWVEGGRGHAEIKLSRNPMGEQLLIDMQDSIRTNISVGYRILEATLTKTSGDDEHYRITKWQPLEISSVSVPADPTVGVGRSDENRNSVKIKEEKPMDEVIQTQETPTDEIERSVSDVEKPQIRSASTQETLVPSASVPSDAQRIASTGAQYGADALANEHIRNNKSYEEFNSALLRTMQEKRKSPDAESTMFDMDVPAQDLQRYSVVNLFRAIATGNFKKAGLEREISNALAERSGKDPDGCYISAEALGFGIRQQMQRQMMFRQQAAGTSGKGAELVATELHSELFIEALRSMAMLGGLGARFMSGLVGNVDIPKQSGTSSFYWVGEDGEATDSDISFSTVQLSPHTVATAVPMTRRMMIQSTPDIEALVRNDIMLNLALAMDSAGIKGSGLSNEPTGIINTSGIGAVDLTGGVTNAKIVEFETDVAEADASAEYMAYLMRPSMRGTLKTTERATGTAKFLWGDDNRVNGYDAFASTQMDAGNILFGDFSQVMFGMWGALDVVADRSTKVKSGGLVMRLFQDVDVAVRHAQAFSLGTTS